jgi:dipeptidyl aminopeptidase/acylaminoacyl peptidase
MPSELFLFEFGSNQVETQFSFANKTLLSELKMGKVEQRMVKTTDNKDMLVWVIYPPDFDPTKKYPTLLYCQGGPQSAVSQFFSYRWNFQLMAAKGYIVVAPNRRGLPGFGSEWNDAIQGDYGGQCMKDYLSAIDAVAKESYVDKNKLGAVGASFGGYSVYWLAGNHNKRFKTFIAHCGMFNMESWYGTTEEMFFANSDNKGPYWEQKSSPNNFDASPHKFVKNWDTPILVIHNEKDYRVPLGQGMEAFTAAQVKGIKSKFLYFPDENHWVVKPQNSILWQRVFFDWLDQTIK